MKRYDCLLFDLDRTLWDVEKNQKEALRVLYSRYRLDRYCPDFELCFEYYERSNSRLWEEYRDGKVTREVLRNTRFEEMLDQIGVHDLTLARQMGDDYVRLAPTFTNMIPHATEVARELSRRYPMYIVTNGFVETQHIKLRNCGLAPYFREIVCSEEAGANKPSPIIFEYALRKAGVQHTRAVMIGDDPETDILGAVRAEIDTVWFNPHHTTRTIEPTYEISALPELFELL